MTGAGFTGNTHSILPKLITATKHDTVLFNRHEETIFVIEFSAPAEQNVDYEAGRKVDQISWSVIDRFAEAGSKRRKILIQYRRVCASRMQKVVILGSLRALGACPKALDKCYIDQSICLD